MPGKFSIAVQREREREREKPERRKVTESERI